jgi:thioesterase domain-containing protein
VAVGCCEDAVEIVRLQDGDGSASVYCLPTSSGAIDLYFELVKTIGPGHLIYGIQFADRLQTGKFKEFSSLREMATAMLPEFLAHHLDGPICLIGYSFASYLAIELAQQLIGLSKTVPLVVIIDGKPPSASFTPFVRMKHFIRYVGPWMIKVATRAITDTDFRTLFYYKMVGSSWYAKLPEDRQHYIKKNHANAHSYRFEGVYRNKIILFRSAGHGASLRCSPGEDYGWGGITGASVDVVYIPGDHLLMMRNPNVVHIANALRPVLSDLN